MCSLNNENEETDSLLPVTIPANLRNLEKCNKCKNDKPSVILRNKDVYCKSCFLAGTIHKFKSFIGKHHLVKANDSVLVWFKTGHASVSLVHLLRSGLDLKTPKKLKFTPIILYIARNNCKLEILQEINNLIKSTNFKIYFISLNRHLCNSYKLNEILYSNIEDFTKFCLETDGHGINKNATISETLEKIYIQQLLTDVAKFLNCSTIFIPDTSVNVASDILSNVCLGRGANLPFDTGICDTRDPQVSIVKPLRHFDLKEIVFYNFYHQLCPVISPLDGDGDNRKSVNHLIQKFVNNLQNNFPATITTVLRTGDKLTVNNDVSATDQCNLCKAPIESTQSENLNAAIATNFSHWISTKLQHFENDNNFNQFQHKTDNSFCYSCSKIVNFIDKEIRFY